MYQIILVYINNFGDSIMKCKILLCFLSVILLISCNLFNPDNNNGVIETGTVTDIEGNVYNTIKVGDLWWMTENLKVSTYTNGDSINLIIDNTLWCSTDSGAYCIYGLDSSKYDTTGQIIIDSSGIDTSIYLYNWHTLNDTSGLAPSGWRIPTDDDWGLLESYLGMDQYSIDSTSWRGDSTGYKLKSISEWGNNGNGSDEISFMALPCGYRDISAQYLDKNNTAIFWTLPDMETQKVWFRYLHSNKETINHSYIYTNYGFSVRCVKDAEE